MDAETEARVRLQQRSASRARNRAMRELARRHPSEFHSIYETEAVKEGVMPHSVRRRITAENADPS